MAEIEEEEELRVVKVSSLHLRKPKKQTQVNECQTIYTVRPHILINGNTASVLKNITVQTAVSIGVDDPNSDLLEKINTEAILQACAEKLENGEDGEHGEDNPEDSEAIIEEITSPTESATTQTMTSERSSSAATYFSDTALRETLHFSLNKLTMELEQLKEMYGKVTEIINEREAASEKRQLRMEHELIKYRNELSLAKLTSGADEFPNSVCSRKSKKKAKKLPPETKSDTELITEPNEG